MKLRTILLIALTAVLCTACKKNNIYSDLLKQERKLIESFINRQGIIVVHEEPEEWAENVYWQIPDYDNFYFHMTELGDTTQAELEANEVVLLRYKRYSLDIYADTLYNWSTLDSADPIKLQYLVHSEYSCEGWQLALKYMKYNGAQCKIICPSKLGFSEENNAVTPYGYDLKMKIKRY